MITYDSITITLNDMEYDELSVELSNVQINDTTTIEEGHGFHQVGGLEIENYDIVSISDNAQVSTEALEEAIIDYHIDNQ